MIGVAVLRAGAVKGMIAVLIAGAGTVGTIVISESGLPVRTVEHHASRDASQAAARHADARLARASFIGSAAIVAKRAH